MSAIGIRQPVVYFRNNKAAKYLYTYVYTRKCTWQNAYSICVCVTHDLVENALTRRRLTNPIIYTDLRNNNIIYIIAGFLFPVK